MGKIMKRFDWLSFPDRKQRDDVPAYGDSQRILRHPLKMIGYIFGTLEHDQIFRSQGVVLDNH